MDDGARDRPRRRRPVRIAEVAALAGVSIATVSRALAKPDRVNGATRQRVLEAVRRTGYTPNIAARSLRARRSMLVLVVVPNLITAFFAELLLGVDQALSERGYGLLIGNLHDRPEKESHLLDLVLAGGVDGVLLLAGNVLEADGRSLADSAVPIVAVSVPSPLDLPQVLVDERRAAREVAAHLLDLGHRRFAYVAGPAGHYCEVERWAGFSAALAEAGLDPAAVPRLPGDFLVDSGVAAASRLLELSLEARPTAVFAASDEMAIGVLSGLREAGVAVPGAVSVVGYDGIAFADFCAPRLTTVRQPREAMGRAAAGLLLRLIAGEAVEGCERSLRLPALLRVAESTGPPARG